MKFKIIAILITFSLTLQVFAIQNSETENAKQLLKENKLEDAKILLETLLEKDDKNHEAYYLLGNVYMKLREPEEATENFEEAVDLQDKNPNYHFALGQAIAMDAQSSNVISQAMMAGDILDEFERTVELDPTHIPGRLGVIGFYTNAPGIMGGDLEKAKANARVVVKLDEARGRMALAQIYLKEEKMDSVEIQIKLFEEKYENDKSASSFYNSLGYFYLGQGNRDKAIIAFKKQVKLNPTSANAYDSLGDGYRAAKRYEDAIAQYKKALEIDPSFFASAENIEELQEMMEE